MSPFEAVSVGGTVGLGAAGGVATHFVAPPLVRVYELREQVWEELLFTANVTFFDKEAACRKHREAPALRGAGVGASSWHGRGICAACSASPALISPRLRSSARPLQHDR